MSVGAVPEVVHGAAMASNAVQLLRVRDVARRLDISERGAWALIYTGALRSVKIGRSRRVSDADLVSFLDELRARSIDEEKTG